MVIIGIGWRGRRVYLNMRNNHRTKCHCRAFATSADGGAHFGELEYDDALISPVFIRPYFHYAGPSSVCGLRLKNKSI